MLPPEPDDQPTRQVAPRFTNGRWYFTGRQRFPIARNTRCTIPPEWTYREDHSLNHARQCSPRLRTLSRARRSSRANTSRRSRVVSVHLTWWTPRYSRRGRARRVASTKMANRPINRPQSQPCKRWEGWPWQGGLTSRGRFAWSRPGHEEGAHPALSQPLSPRPVRPPLFQPQKWPADKESWTSRLPRLFRGVWSSWSHQRNLPSTTCQPFSNSIPRFNSSIHCTLSMPGLEEPDSNTRPGPKGWNCCRMNSSIRRTWIRVFLFRGSVDVNVTSNPWMIHQIVWKLIGFFLRIDVWRWFGFVLKYVLKCWDTFEVCLSLRYVLIGMKIDTTG